MKREQLYDNWKKHKSQVEVGYSFAETVMNQVQEYEQNRKKPFLSMQRCIEVICAYPLAKAGIVAMGAITGLARVAFIIHVLFFGN